MNNTDDPIQDPAQRAHELTTAHFGTALIE